MSGAFYIGSVTPASMGQINKLYSGSELIWPPASSLPYFYGTWDLSGNLQTPTFIVPAGFTRVSLCIIGCGGFSQSGGGGGGGGLGWMNFNATVGDAISFSGVAPQSRILANIYGTNRATAFPGANSAGTPGGAGGTVTFNNTGVLSGLTTSASTGGAGGSIFSGGQAGGGGGSGGYTNGTPGSAGGSGGNNAGGFGINGSSGGGGGTQGGVAGGAGRTSPFGRGDSGSGGASNQNGGNGSVVTGPGALILGGGGSRGFSGLSTGTPGAWAVRFHNGEAEYPLLVVPTLPSP